MSALFLTLLSCALDLFDVRNLQDFNCLLHNLNHGSCVTSQLTRQRLSVLASFRSDPSPPHPKKKVGLAPTLSFSAFLFNPQVGFSWGSGV